MAREVKRKKRLGGFAFLSSGLETEVNRPVQLVGALGTL